MSTMQRDRAALGLILVAGLVGACNDREFGRGLGRPDYVAPEGVERIPVEITATYVAGPTTSRFVRLAPISGTVNLEGLSLRGLTGETPLSGTIDGARIFCAPAALDDAHAGAGEVAVVDADGNVHALLAWGADPSTLGSPSIASAVLTGAAPPGAFVALPFPAPDVGIAREGAVAGCAPVVVATDCSVTGTIQIDPIDAGLCAPVAPTLLLTEVLPGLTGGSSWAEIENTGADAVDLFGVRLCSPPACPALPAATLAAGARVLVNLGTPAPTEADGHIYLPAAPALPASGEVAIVAPGSSEPAQAALIQSFVRYGTGSGLLTTAAVEAGAWDDAMSTALPPRIAGESLSLTPGAEGTVAGWYPTEATPDAPNVAITAGDAVWTSCSYPKTPGPEADLVISSLGRGAPQSITVTNRSGASLDLRDYVLALPGASLTLADGTEIVPLLAGSSLLIELDADDDGCTVDTRCWSDAAATLSESGEAFITMGGAVTFYLRWGSAVASAELTEAVGGGLWPLERCALELLDADDTIELDSKLSGQSPADYHR